MNAPLQCSVQSWTTFSEGSLISRIYNDLDKTSTKVNKKIALIDLADTNVLNTGQARVHVANAWQHWTYARALQLLNTYSKNSNYWQESLLDIISKNIPG